MPTNSEIIPIMVIPLSEAFLCVTCDTVHNKKACPTCANNQNIALSSLIKDSIHNCNQSKPSKE